MAKSEVRTIVIRWDTDGKRVASQTVSQLKSINNQMRQTSSTMSTLRSAFGAYLGIRTVSVLTQWADTFQLLRDRMSVFTGSTESANGAMSQLQDVAKFTKSSMSGMATVFNRVALATKDLGLNMTAIIGLTTSLQQTFRLSGATIAEATSSTIQLTQGLAAGALRGQELRSVLEANAVFGGILAKEFGVTRGALIKLGETGTITSDRVLKAMAKNFVSLNEQASKLGVTFEQSVTIAMDNLRFKVHELNQSFGLSTKFSKLMEFGIDHLGSIVAGVATVAVPLLITSLKRLAIAMISNPMTAILVAIGLAVGVIVDNFDELSVRGAVAMAHLSVAGNELHLSWLMVKKAMMETFKILSSESSMKQVSKDIVSATKDVENSVTKSKKSVAELNKFLADKKTKKKDFLIQKYVDALSEAANNTHVDKIRKGMQLLNNEFQRTGDIDKYQSSLASLKMGELNQKFKEGKVDVSSYYAELTKISDTFSVNGTLFAGVDGYIQKAGNLSSNIAGAITSTFGHLEDTLVSFTETGKLSFTDMTKSILSDLNRILIKALIIKPLAGSLLGSISSINPDTTNNGFANADPNIVSQPVDMYASGGVVNTPTFFSNNGRPSVAGEDGPEGILPLKRASNGDLGVTMTGGGGSTNVAVNIINNAGADVSARESKDSNGNKVIEVMIQRQVAQGFADGTFDKPLQSNYGLARKAT